ncbi:hypothetical protein LCGC14_2878220 [marine sediment metagenome]|uniref:Uncharacterized protein n=1 Tax=marine sediment metagenome TaxID=412755 RepID=A0A0F8Y0V2_9ZZZZ
MSTVSLPGPLPRLLIDDDITVNITPKEFDAAKYALDTLRDNNIIDVIISEIGGSINN